VTERRSLNGLIKACQAAYSPDEDFEESLSAFNHVPCCVFFTFRVQAGRAIDHELDLLNHHQVSLMIRGPHPLEHCTMSCMPD